MFRGSFTKESPMNRYLNPCKLSAGVAVVLGLASCGIESPDIGTATESIVNQWFLTPFDGRAIGPLNGQDGWGPVAPGDGSPTVIGPVIDGTYNHGNVVRLVDKGVRSSSRGAVIAATSGPVQLFHFQVRVNENVLGNNNKAALVL